MICYMPFTHLTERRLHMLAHAFEPLTIYSPAADFVPDHMRSWQTEGRLIIKHPAGLDEAQLSAAVENYKAWADQHQGRIGDMAAFITTQQGQHPMTDETHPTHISHQIRHFSSSEESDTICPLFNAALFLSMAQAFDLYHNSMSQDMATIHAMEQQMMHQLTGRSQDDRLEFPIKQTPAPSTGDSAQYEPYMTAARVRAWSQLVLADTTLSLLYITPSRAVLEHVVNIFPDSQVLEIKGFDPSQSLESIQSMTVAPESQPIEWDSILQPLTADHNMRAAIYKLEGLSPFAFLTRLSGQEQDGHTDGKKAELSENTFFGWVSPG